MIKKYKNIEHSEDKVWIMNPDDKYYEKINDFFAMWGELSEFKVKRGIQKFRNPFVNSKQSRNR
jgi:hypothetical protein